MNINSIITEAHYFEGFLYVSYNGEFFKGCSRCGGTGHYSFNGMDSICYKCGNTSAKLGDAFENEAQAQKWCHERAVRKGQADRKREALRLAKLAKRDAAWQALKDQHPDVWELLSSVAGVAIPFTDGQGEGKQERSNFIASIADKLFRLDEIKLTERQIEAVQAEANKRNSKQAEAALTPAPAGRVVVTGEIISSKAVDSEYGTSYKILVKDDAGFKVWCSIPKAQADQEVDRQLAELSTDAPVWPVYDLWFNEIKGRRITFTATLEPSQDDVAFAFGSRPTKGAWL